MSLSAAVNRGVLKFLFMDRSKFTCVACIPVLVHFHAFFHLILKFSRIELLRGNAEEAIRLNVREIEALQVLFLWH
jgi:hypothetical protein